MTLDRTDVVEQQFTKAIESDCLPEPLSSESSGLCSSKLISVFDSQIKSRLLDLIARKLKEKGKVFYTIGSSGHEGNAVMGQRFPYHDMAFLHYRSGAFFIERAKQQNIDGVYDVLLSLVAARDNNISGGRHKVFGSVALNIPPQTSTIASHLPKALGAVLSLSQKRDDQHKNRVLKRDGVILVSFGDASLNHASAQTTINAASRLGYIKHPLPLVFICEDNGIGISVPTPNNWVKNSIISREGIEYISADGVSLPSLINACERADVLARKQKKCVFLHMKCRRILGHAGSDIEQQYLSLKQIEANEAHCPLLHSAAFLIEQKILSKQDVLELYHKIEEEIWQKADDVIKKPKLKTAKEIKEFITPRAFSSIQYLPADEKKRQSVFKEKLSHLSIKRTMQQLINLALTDLFLQYPHAVLFGEDVAKKGGVYRVTADLQKQFGAHRVFDTILDETTILGTAIGFAHNGFLPVPEIQFLAYLHNAEDQLRGEAATLSFFSSGDYKNPMVVRIAALAYQKGFGGHFHNDNSIAVLRDIPGIIVACPSNGESAVELLRECFRLAHQEGRVVVFLEPIALYMTKDLYKKGDELMLKEYPPLTRQISFGEITCHGEGEVLIISYANGLFLSLQAQKQLVELGIKVKVLDLNWLSPLPIEAVIEEVKKAVKVLIVDEGRKSGSLSEELITLLLEHLGNSLPPLKRITGEDSFIPLGDSWQSLLPSTEGIVKVIREF